MRFLRRIGPAGPDGDSTDRQLLRRFATSRDEAAFAALVRRHGPMVLGVCRRVLRNAADAEDAFQATFLVLVRKAASMADPDLLGNWLYGVAYRTALKARMEAGRRRASEGEVPFAGILDPKDKVAAGEQFRVLDDELKKLPTKYRLAIVLCYLEGRTHTEVAAQLGCPRQTVTTRLTRACDILRARLLRRGLALTVGALATLFSQEHTTAEVPVGLTTGTVQAASSLALAESVLAGAVPDRVANLARGVIRSMYLNRLQGTAAVLFFVVTFLVGAGLLVRGATSYQSPDAAARKTVTAESSQEPVGQEEKKEVDEFQKLYALPKGVNLRRIAPPFDPSRDEYFNRNLLPKGVLPFSPGAMYFRSTGKRVNLLTRIGGPVALSSLPSSIWLKILPQQVEGPKDLLDTRIEGDFILRIGVPDRDVLPTLEKILREECQLPVKLSLREVERKVIVVKGKYRPNPLEGRERNEVKVYAQIHENGFGGGGSGDLTDLLNGVGTFIGRQLVNEVELAPTGQLRWHYDQCGSNASDEARRAERDEKSVLNHLAEQTGLTFTERVRRVTVLLMERTD
jgi:RNA polymerase sigma factor (sigma-70 family)